MGRRNDVDEALVKSLPGVLVSEVPIGVNHSVVSLNVRKEGMIVEDTPYPSEHPMHPRVV